MRTLHQIIFTALLLCAALALGALPAAIAEGDFTVTAEPATLEITEGANQLLENTLSAHYEATPSSISVTINYRWFLCDEDGSNRQEAPGRNNGENMYNVHEELAPGTYYFVCEVTGYDINTQVVDTVSSTLVKVVINAGAPLVVFDPAEGSFAEIGSVPISINLRDGKLTSSAPTPAKEGFIFLYWADSNGERVADPDSSTFAHTTRLYAQYAAKTTTTFDANGGAFSTGATALPVSHPEGIMRESDLPDDPQRKGYLFQGWYFTFLGTEYALEEVSEGADAYLPTEYNVTIYAKWAADPSVPQTGDPSLPLTWLGLIIVSAAGLMLLQKKVRV